MGRIHKIPTGIALATLLLAATLQLGAQTRRISVNADSQTVSAASSGTTRW